MPPRQKATAHSLYAAGASHVAFHSCTVAKHKANLQRNACTYETQCYTPPYQLPTTGAVDCLATAGPPATDAEAAAAAAAGAGAGAGDVISHHRGEDVAPAD